MLIMSLYLVFPHQNMWIFVFWTLCMAWSIYLWKKAPKMHRIRKAKVFRRPNILIMPIYLIFFHQKMWIFIFWTPCIAKIAFYWLGLSIFQKRLPKCTASERQNFLGDPIFWSCPYLSIFSTRIWWFLSFWTPCMAKMAFY